MNNELSYKNFKICSSRFYKKNLREIYMCTVWVYGESKTYSLLWLLLEIYLRYRGEALLKIKRKKLKKFRKVHKNFDKLSLNEF